MSTDMGKLVTDRCISSLSNVCICFFVHSKISLYRNFENYFVFLAGVSSDFYYFTYVALVLDK